MLFASWLSSRARSSALRSRHSRRKCPVSIAACVEIFEDKALLSGWASYATLSLPHSTASMTRSATTSVIYFNDLAPPSAVITTAPTKGSAIDNANGTFTYTANTNEVGTDSFIYQNTDSESVTHTATVSITLGNNPAYA
jgi:Big-like domain-containing protein